jgi:diadenylate cyclase
MEMLSRYLTEERIIFLKAGTTEDAIKEMAGAIAVTVPGLERRRVIQAVLEREHMVSSWLAPGVAIPHARLPGLVDFILAIGISSSGIAGETGDKRPVRLFIMILGREEEPDRHVRLLAQVARMLKQSSLQKHIAGALSAKDVLAHVMAAENALKANAPATESSRLILDHAVSLADEAGARAILLHADIIPDITFLDAALQRGLEDRLILVTSGRSDLQERTEGAFRSIRVPFPSMNRQNQIEIALIFALSKGLLNREDAVVVITGTPQSGMLDTLSLIHIHREFPTVLPAEDMSPLGDLDPLVLEKILQTAVELSVEGREGKPVGTAFIVGDYERVVPHCHQLVINPFKGYRDDEKNILDPNLDETVKEFSLLDGAFVIRGDGVIMSAGVFLRTRDVVENLPSGLGARHAAAAAITLCTRAVAVVVSQSTGTVSLFSGGKTAMVLGKRKREGHGLENDSHNG